MSRTNISGTKTEKKSKIVPKNHLNPEVSDKVCRICMENVASTQLINPCKCIGSVKFVHERCLKSWLLSQKRTSKRAHCEICKTQFQMEFKYSKKCIFWNKTKAKAHFFYMPLFITVLFSLLAIIYLITTNSIALKGNNKFEYKIVIIILCSAFSFIFLVLTVSIIKETCVVVKLDQWTIKSGVYDKEEVESREHFDETSVRELKVEEDISDEKKCISSETKESQNPHMPINNTFMVQHGRNYSDEFMISNKIGMHKYSTSQPLSPNEVFN